MPIVRTGETEYDKEMAKWDAPRREGGMRPDGYEPFPKMLYFARELKNGKAAVADVPGPRGWYSDDNTYLSAELEAQRFTSSCQRVVRNSDELERAYREGWRETPADALAHYEALQREIATAAAEANFAATRMSDKAQAERRRRESATDKHVPE